jgi:integrase/recombinase XerD
MEKRITTKPNQSSVAVHQQRQDFDTLIDAFLRAHDVKEISRECYRRRLKSFFTWCIANQIKSPSRETILDYKRHLRDEKYSSTSQAAYLVAVRLFFAFCEQENLYRDVAKSIKGPKRERGFRKDALTVSQVHDLLSSIDRTTLKGARDFAAINLMIRTGLRTIEMVRADICDVRQQGGECVLWVQGKSEDSKNQFVVLVPDTLKPIQEYLSMRPTTKDDECLFGSTSDGNRHQRLTTKAIRRLVKERLRAIHLNSNRLSAHALRHTSITIALLAGAPLTVDGGLESAKFG